MPQFPGHPGTIFPVLAPLFAFHSVTDSSFQWLLVGDADTIFSVPAVLRLLNDLGLSADEPHAISDFLVECEPCESPTCKCGPIRDDPRCLPCADDTRPCPCRLVEGCSRPRAIRREGVNATAAGSASPRAGCPVQGDVSAYGGAGLILSVGMLRELTRNPEYYIPTAFRSVLYETPYSDVALSNLCQGLGYGFTRLPPLPPPPPAAPPPLLPPPPPPAPGEANASAVAPPAALNPPIRRFGSFSVYNDMRPLRDQLLELVARQRLSTGGGLEAAVSHHVRSAPGQSNVAAQILPPYRAIAKLLLRQHALGSGGDWRRSSPG